MSYTHYRGTDRAQLDALNDTFLNSYANARLDSLVSGLQNEYKFFYIEQFAVPVVADTVGGVLRLRSAVGDVNAAMGGIGPATPPHVSQLGGDFSGKQIAPIRGPGGSTVSEGVMEVVPRPGMEMRVIFAENGQMVRVYGQAEFSTSTTNGHAAAMLRIVEENAKSGQYKFFLLQRSWRTATLRQGKSRLIPDVIASIRGWRTIPAEWLPA